MSDISDEYCMVNSELAGLVAFLEYEINDLWIAFQNSTPEDGECEQLLL